MKFVNMDYDAPPGSEVAYERQLQEKQRVGGSTKERGRRCLNGVEGGLIVYQGICRLSACHLWLGHHSVDPILFPIMQHISFSIPHWFSPHSFPPPPGQALMERERDADRQRELMRDARLERHRQRRSVTLVESSEGRG